MICRYHVMFHDDESSSRNHVITTNILKLNSFNFKKPKKQYGYYNGSHQEAPRYDWRWTC